MNKVFLLFLCTCTFCFAQRSDFSHINFKKADSIALKHKGASLKNLPVLTHKLTASLPTDVEKFRAIYSWVCTNIENDYSSYLVTIKKRKKLVKNKEAFIEWNTNYSPKVFKNLLQHKKTACTGYAYIVRELSQLAGIECKIVNGYGRTPTLRLNTDSTPNHSWNAVQLNNKWFLCDATWSSGEVKIDEGNPKFIPQYFKGYFLANPALFIKNHYPLETTWTLITEPPTIKEFIEGPIIYKEIFTSNVIPLEPKKMEFVIGKNTSVDFSLAIPENSVFKDVTLLINRGNSSKNITPIVSQNQNIVTLKHNFTKLGFHDVHIKIDDTIIATYVVIVRKNNF